MGNIQLPILPLQIDFYISLHVSKCCWPTFVCVIGKTHSAIYLILGLLFYLSSLSKMIGNVFGSQRVNDKMTKTKLRTCK